MPGTAVGLAVLALVSTGCFSRSLGDRSIPGISPVAALRVASGAETLGDVLSPEAALPVYIFERATPHMAVQKASRVLVGVLTPHRNLLVGPLSSTKETAAVILVEVSFHARWGALMIPAERQIIRAFANDQTMGKWLILLTDVVVRDGPDPVPVTAYRWTRDEVERYRRCGIPDSQIDDCTDAFYEAARTVLLPSGVRILKH